LGNSPGWALIRDAERRIEGADAVAIDQFAALPAGEQKEANGDQ